MRSFKFRITEGLILNEQLLTIKQQALTKT
jgi:hypothetical protein